MSLRAQLLVFGLLTLWLPWAGLRFVEEMERALRAGLESALLASAGTVAAAISSRSQSVAAPVWRGSADAADTIYGHALRAPPRIDGLRDDWVLERPEPIAVDADHLIWVGADDRFAYVFVEVHDDDVVYETLPGEAPYGDRVALVLGAGPATSRALLLATAAPGTFRARETDVERFVPKPVFEGRVVAAWQEFAGGYNVEARVPLGLTGDGLGIGVVDVDRVGAGYATGIASTWGAERAAPSALVYERPEIRALVEQFTQAGGRFRVLDQSGWIIASSGTVGDVAFVEDPGVAAAFFRFVLSRDDPPYAALESPAGRLDDASLRGALDGERAVAWYDRGPSDAAVVAAAVPIELPPGSTRSSHDPLGAVLLEQASDPILTLTNRTLMRLMGLTVMLSVVAAGALLGYATFLSFRVRRLARAAETALGPRGEINVALPGRGAKDEIGALARSFGDLLGRLSEYTDYLRTLSSKLAHELRTPLAIVTTSLDNLRHEVREGPADVYVQRLREGAERLESILGAMSAATKIEHAIAETVAEPYDLRAVLESCAAAYRDIYPSRRFTCVAAPGPHLVLGSSELFAQMLDKLVENAVSFSDEGSTIALSLTAATPAEHEVAVSNEGTLLPDAMRHQIFDSLVSVRAGNDDRPHLGLGLYIVALIADFHGGRATAENLPDASGVIVRVRFPRLRR